MRHGGHCCLIDRVAVIPSTIGISTSMRITSGCRVAANSIALCPFSASPTMSMSSSSGSSVRSSRRTCGTSSTMRMRVVFMVGLA